MTREQMKQQIYKIVDAALDRASASKEEDHFLPHFVSEFVRQEAEQESEIQYTFTISKEDNVSEMLQFFEYEHLPGRLRELSELFYDLAHDVVHDLPQNSERAACLRKLLEAKDCAVRAALSKE